MKHVHGVVVCLGVVLSTGCVGPQGHSMASRRDYVQRMKQETLDELYARKPDTREKIQQAAGYGVFSNIGFTAIFVGAGNGYGVVVDKSGGKETYMRMFSGSAGLGLGVKDFRVVFVFYDRPTLEKFVRQGWEFAAEGEASGKLSDKGGAAGAQGTLTQAMEIFQITENGISASATVAGAKFWWDGDLNNE